MHQAERRQKKRGCRRAGSAQKLSGEKCLANHGQAKQNEGGCRAVKHGRMAVRKFPGEYEMAGAPADDGQAGQADANEAAGNSQLAANSAALL